MRFFVGALSLVLATVANAFSYTKEFTEEELQSQIDALMPLQRKALMVTVTISEPSIDLYENENKIGIQATISTNAPGGLKGSGSVHFAGSVFYVREEGAFYIKDPEIVSMSINGLPEAYIASIQPIAQSLIAKALASRPVYVLQGDDLRQKMAKATLDSVEVVDERLRVKLKAF